MIFFVCMCLFDSHGQLGHGGLTSEEEPRAVEALWGMPMSCVATGGWHSVCVSGKCYTKMLTMKWVTALSLRDKNPLFFTDGGDLYVWGWNESGQLGLPSRGLRKAPQQQRRQQAGLSVCSNRNTLKGHFTPKHNQYCISFYLH